MNNASTGDFRIDVTDVTKTTGLISVDITGIELFQTLVKDGKPAEETKSELQNKHARTWLQISDDAPPDEVKKNARVDYSIKSIESASTKDVTKMTGAERKVTLHATGDFLLHGRKSVKQADLEATFVFDGDKPVSVRIKTAKPFNVNLAEHEVQPRETFGKLAQKGLSALSNKVASDALVSLDFTAKPGETGAAPH